MSQIQLSSEEMLARLVGFDTTSSKSNLELIHWVQGYLQGHGVESTLVHDATKTKANLHAVVGPLDVAGVVLSGHTDVVPVDGQDWASDPFILREDEGLLYGRGSCDMKGFLAVALAKLPELLAQPLKAPVHFALSYDEEIGCFGAHDLADHIVGAGVAPRLCIVGEPTMMKLITGHKGYCRYDCTVRGREAHSSLAPYAVNAVEYAAEMVAHIKTVARRQASEGPFNREFDPPFTTVHTGVINGGTALNIVPQLCEFSFEIRSIPETDPDALAEEIRQYAFRTFEPHMKDIDATAGFEFKKKETVPAFNIANDAAAVELVMAMSGANAAEKVSFVTEAGIFQEKGIPTVVCGPGSIKQAHKPNEFVAIDQLRKCETFVDRLAEHLCVASG